MNKLFKMMFIVITTCFVYAITCIVLRYFNDRDMISKFIDSIYDNIHFYIKIIILLICLNISVYLFLYLLIIHLYNEGIPEILIQLPYGTCEVCYESSGYALNVVTFKSCCHVCNFKLCTSCYLKLKHCPQCRNEHKTYYYPSSRISLN